MRLFLDANVLVSAARNPDGRAAVVFNLAAHGLCTLVASPFAIEEARRNLEIKHTDLGARLDRVIRSISICSEAAPETVAWASAQKLPDKEAPILAAAVEAQADLLVTGDRTHFGHMYGKTLRVWIVPPAGALRRLPGGR